MTRPYTGMVVVPVRRLTILALAACVRDAPRPAASSPAATAPCGVAPNDSAPVHEIVVAEHARGMTTEIRWARSPDGCALLVVEDPAGAEAEPVPDAALLARSAHGATSVLRVDSVWDVAPDSAWRRLAVGRAHVARGGGADTLSASAWSGLARAVGRSVGDVRGAAFAASGMSLAMAVAQPAWADVSGGDAAVVWHVLPVLAGWRVRWAPDGVTLLVGAAPRQVDDDAPGRAWLRVDASRGVPLGAPVTLPGEPQGVAWRRVSLPRTSADTLATTVDGRVVLAIVPPRRVVLSVRGYRPM